MLYALQHIIYISEDQKLKYKCTCTPNSLVVFDQRVSFFVGVFVENIDTEYSFMLLIFKKILF